MTDDRQLLAAWGDGNAAAGHELFERHFAAVFRFFRNKAGDDLEDLVQTTFLRCLETRASFRGEASFRTFLFAVARNELYSYWRKRQKVAATVDIGSVSVEDLGTTPSGAAHQRRERALLARALQAIPLDLQIALELHYWEELTGPELAAALDIPEGTVRSRLRRGKALLEEQIRKLSEGDAELLQSSLSGLEGWAASLKAFMSR